MKKNKINYINKIFFLLGASKKKFFSLNLLFIISSLLEILTLSSIALILNYVFNNDKSSEIILFISKLSFVNLYFEKLIYFLLFFLLFIISFKSIYIILVEFLIQRFALIKQKELRLLIVNNFFNINYLEILNIDSSSYMAAINLFVGKFSRLIVTLLSIIRDTIIILCIFVVLFITNKNIFLILLLTFSILYFFYNLFFIRKTKLYGQNLNNSVQNLFQSLKEAIDGIKEIKNFKIYNFYLKKFSSLSNVITNNSLKTTLIMTSPRHLLEFFLVLVLTLFLLLNYDENNSAQFIPALGVFAYASMRLIPIFNQLINHFIVFRSNIDTVDKLYNFIKDKNNYSYQNLSIPKNDFKSLKFKNIEFSYNQNKIILSSSSFNINKGEIVGIYGDSGVGKSTFLHILMGYLKIQNGEILINNKIENQFSSKIQDLAVYLSQKPFLINGTILDNIALGTDPNDIDLNKIYQSIKIAGLDNINVDINKLLETNIGENGSKVSFGQKQRIIIARSIYFDRELLVMDESTSSLDKMSEHKILNSLSSLKSKFSIIIISHNEAIKDFCDRVYELKNKKLIEL